MRRTKVQYPGLPAEAALHKYQPGREIVVKYDLYDNSKVVIDHS